MNFLDYFLQISRFTILFKAGLTLSFLWANMNFSENFE